METPLSTLRREYMLTRLDERDADPDPFCLFATWFDAAAKSGVVEPNGMTLATVGPDGQPSARTVLLKGFDSTGFVFFSNYESRKGRDLAVNPRAALLFWWSELERQVRIEGVVSQVSAAESDAYFASRPYPSQLGACASPQSREIESRGFLESELLTLAATYAGKSIPRPTYWGGYRLEPLTLEFWQGRESRLHDRLRYSRATDGATWRIARLAP